MKSIDLQQLQEIVSTQIKK